MDRDQAACAAEHPEWLDLPATERTAKEAGVTRFFNGRPCKRGHVSPRYAAGGLCIECDVAYCRGYNRLPKTRERSNAWARVNYRDNPPSDDKKAAQRDYMQRYWQQPEVKAANRERMVAISRARDAAKLKATPHWLTEQDWAAMRAVYDEAARLTRETGIPHHVDHVVPLRATCPRTKQRNACGLHVPANLQVLTKQENIAKLHWFDDWT